MRITDCGSEERRRWALEVLQDSDLKAFSLSKRWTLRRISPPTVPVFGTKERTSPTCIAPLRGTW